MVCFSGVSDSTKGLQASLLSIVMQVYVRLKRKDAYSIRTLVECLKEVKAWMAVILHFNEMKTDSFLVLEALVGLLLCTWRCAGL